MIIGIPADIDDTKSAVSGSFGRAPLYFIYNTLDEKGLFIENTARNAQGGAGVKAAQLLLDQNVEAVITPQLGENASMVLKAAKIELYKSENGTLMDNVLRLGDGQLELLLEIHQGYHGH